MLKTKKPLTKKAKKALLSAALEVFESFHTITFLLADCA